MSDDNFSGPYYRDKQGRRRPPPDRDRPAIWWEILILGLFRFWWVLLLAGLLWMMWWFQAGTGGLPPNAGWAPSATYTSALA